MHELGHTRSRRQPDHFLLSPDSFIRAALPGMKHCAAVVHAGPAIGAGFTAYTAEFESHGELGETRAQRFFYVISGEVELETQQKTTRLNQHGYAFLPQGLNHRVTAAQVSRMAVFEKTYQPLTALDPPQLIVSCEDTVQGSSLEGDPDLEVKCLLPDGFSFDLAVNTMLYQPGAALSRVEMHIMEHGLFMLEGGGIYRLGDDWYSVKAGDFIWMGPWCPQWFAAIGKVPAKYLIYKDWNRHPLGEPLV
jgi:(S)-ureidoglycine aminohydrolase